MYCVTLPAGSSSYFEYAFVALGSKPCIFSLCFFNHLRPLATTLGEKARLESDRQNST